MDDIAASQRRRHGRVKRSEIRMPGALVKKSQPPGAEDRRMLTQADMSGQMLDATGPAEEVHRQIELFRQGNRRLGKALPAFDMAAGSIAALQRHEDSDPQGGFAERVIAVGQVGS
jgi:hypothetical protein